MGVKLIIKIINAIYDFMKRIKVDYPTVHDIGRELELDHRTIHKRAIEIDVLILIEGKARVNIKDVAKLKEHIKENYWKK